MSELALVRLLQLASQALPIGGYSHSHALEAAVEQGIVTDEPSAAAWINAALEFSLLSCELPLLLAMHAAWAAGDTAALTALNDELLATRDAAELRAASVQMGYSLTALLAVLPDMPAHVIDGLGALEEPSLPAAWSGAAMAFSIEPRASATAYAWSWAENQVLAAVKTVPLGQSAGQRLLLELGATIGFGAARAARPREAWSNFTPALAILSSRHETQYSRLFRS